jgi:hypothetical protein
MLTPGAIAVFWSIYLFFTYATLKAKRVEERERGRVRELPTKAISETKPIGQPEMV